jgi:hypothetical protein
MNGKTLSLKEEIKIYLYNGAIYNEEPRSKLLGMNPACESIFAVGFQ